MVVGCDSCVCWTAKGCWLLFLKRQQRSGSGVAMHGLNFNLYQWIWSKLKWRCSFLFSASAAAGYSKQYSRLCTEKCGGAALITKFFFWNMAKLEINEKAIYCLTKHWHKYIVLVYWMLKHILYNIMWDCSSLNLLMVVWMSSSLESCSCSVNAAR